MKAHLPETLSLWEHKLCKYVSITWLVVAMAYPNLRTGGKQSTIWAASMCVSQKDQYSFTPLL